MVEVEVENNVVYVLVLECLCVLCEIFIYYVKKIIKVTYKIIMLEVFLVVDERGKEKQMRINRRGEREGEWGVPQRTF